MCGADMGGLLGAHKERAAPRCGAAGARFCSARVSVTNAESQVTERAFLVSAETAGGRRRGNREANAPRCGTVSRPCHPARPKVSLLPQPPLSLSAFLTYNAAHGTLPH